MSAQVDTGFRKPPGKLAVANKDRWFLILALVTLGSAWCAVAAPRDPQPPSVRVGFDSYGFVRIGMTRAALFKVLREPMAADSEASDCGFVWDKQRDDISYMVEEGRVVLIRVAAPAVQSMGGAHIGTTASELRRIYPSIEVTQNIYDSRSFEYTVLAPDRQHGIRFEISHGSVESYYAGTVRAIQYVEGCA